MTQKQTQCVEEYNITETEENVNICKIVYLNIPTLNLLIWCMGYFNKRWSCYTWYHMIILRNHQNEFAFKLKHITDSFAVSWSYIPASPKTSDTSRNPIILSSTTQCTASRYKGIGKMEIKITSGKIISTKYLARFYQKIIIHILGACLGAKRGGFQLFSTCCYPCIAWQLLPNLS